MRFACHLQVQMSWGYGVRDIVGYKYGYSGLNKKESAQIQLDPTVVKGSTSICFRPSARMG